MKKLKVDLHAHCAGDPVDRIAYSAEQLIDEAANKGFDALSFANRRLVTYSRKLAVYAERRGIVLIPGIEKLIEGKHVLLVNVDWHAHAIETFEELRRWKNGSSLVIAPHPYFPRGNCLGSVLEGNIDLFDAVEYSFFYSSTINFNKRAKEVAEQHGIPLVGSCDCHHICDLGTTYTLVESKKEPGAIVEAVRDGRTEVVTRPLPLRLVCARGVGGVVGVLAGTVIQQTYGRLTGALIFEGKAAASRSKRVRGTI
jgi:predicted metal-dependent phosphoesterase TrpH